MTRTKVKNLSSQDFVRSPAPGTNTMCSVRGAQVHNHIDKSKSYWECSQSSHGVGLGRIIVAKVCLKGDHQETEIVVYREKRNKRTWIICIIQSFTTHNFNKWLLFLIHWMFFFLILTVLPHISGLSNNCTKSRNKQLVCDVKVPQKTTGFPPSYLFPLPPVSNSEVDLWINS